MCPPNNNYNDASPLLPSKLPFRTTGNNKSSPSSLPWPLSYKPESNSLVILLISAILYSVMACFVKLSTNTDNTTTVDITTESRLSSTELVFLRAVFQISLVIVAMCWYDDPYYACNNNKSEKLIRRPFGSKTVRNVVIARGIFGGLGFLCYYYTISVLPLGDAMTMLSMSPIVTVLAASMFLNDETIRSSHIVAAIVSLIGSILLARPTILFGSDDNDKTNSTSSTSSSSSPTGYLTGLLGACFGAAVLILVRRAGKVGVHTLQLLFSWCFFAVVYSLVLGIIIPMMVFYFHKHDSPNITTNSDNVDDSDYNRAITTAPSSIITIKSFFVLPTQLRSWMYLLGVCIFGTMAHFLLNYAARHSPPGLASIVRSSGIMWSYIFEIFVFRQVPSKLTVIGFTMILLSLLMIAVEKHYNIIPSTQKKTTNSNNNKSKQQHGREGNDKLNN